MLLEAQSSCLPSRCSIQPLALFTEALQLLDSVYTWGRVEIQGASTLSRIAIPFAQRQLHRADFSRVALWHEILLLHPFFFLSIDGCQNFTCCESSARKCLSPFWFLKSCANKCVICLNNSISTFSSPNIQTKRDFFQFCCCYNTVIGLYV